MKASILAVGTEITTGQILNKNASAISQKLNTYGVSVLAHVAVPDDRQLILDALVFLELQADIIFVTGGLGPTSDDFTRELISEWSQLPLEFNEASWLHVNQRLTSRGFSVREMQRQQCFFPRTSHILTNSQGTANAFYFKTQRPSGNKTVFVLPGPPREIDSIWHEHLVPLLQGMTANVIKLTTKSWDTLGLGESDVAAIVEADLAHFAGKTSGAEKIKIGYRVHLPYVEVKISFSESYAADAKPLLESIDKSLSKITVTKDFVDLAALVTNKVKALDFAFYDFVSQGFLQQRLQPFLKNLPDFSWKQSTESLPVDFFTHETNFMSLLPLETQQKCLVMFDYQGHKHQQVIESPFKSSLMADRTRQYFAEMAVIQLAKFNGAEALTVDQS